jgi:hypothetical protein
VAGARVGGMSLVADDLRLANASTPWALRARLPSPSTPQHGRFTCRLKIYVYRQFLHHLQQQQHSGRWFGFSDTRRVTGATRNVTRNVSCLEGPCIFNGFKYLNVRQYTSEVPIYQRLVTACTVVDEPERADIYLVPFYFGYMMTLGWQVKMKEMPDAWRVEHREMMRAALSLKRALPYLDNRTASRHVLLFTCDSQFVNIDLHKHFRESLIVHLGDDAFHGSPMLSAVHGGSSLGHEKHHLPNGIIVPYRVSQWMPYGFNRSRLVGARKLLLSMNVNMERHPVRRKVAFAVTASAKGLKVDPARLLLSNRMMGPKEAADAALNSTFCLCPTGDSKGFTARFYFVLLHGCIPIRVDGYSRNTTTAPPTYPFPKLIDWSRLVIDVPPSQANMLLPRLLAMPQREIEERQSYLRHTAHWLLFDNEEHAHHDASAALIHQIQARFLGNGIGSNGPNVAVGRRNHSIWGAL